METGVQVLSLTLIALSNSHCQLPGASQGSHLPSWEASLKILCVGKSALSLQSILVWRVSRVSGRHYPVLEKLEDPQSETGSSETVSYQ